MKWTKEECLITNFGVLVGCFWGTFYAFIFHNLVPVLIYMIIVLCNSLWLITRKENSK